MSIQITNDLFESVRQAPFVLDPAMVAARTMSCVASTEIAVRRWHDGEVVDEILPLGSWELPEKVPLLDCHDSYRTDSVRGSAIDFKVVGEELLCNIVFSTTAENDFIKAKEGHLNSVSVRGDVTSYYYLSAGESIALYGKTYTAKTNRPAIVAVKTILRELSLVPLGADERAKIKSEVLTTAKRSLNSINPNKGIIMDPEAIEVKTPVVPVEAARSLPVIDELKVKETAKKEEKIRISSIVESCRSLGVSDVFAQKLVDGDVAIDTARAQIIEEAGKLRGSVDKGSLHVKTAEADNIREALGIVAKRSLSSVTKEEQKLISASPYNSVRGPIGIAKVVLESKGVDTRFMSNSEVYDTVRQQGIADFSYITASAGNTLMIEIYEKNLKTAQLWTGEQDLSNFNTHDNFDVTPLPIMPDIEDKAGVTEVLMGEYAESIKLGTKGYISLISRQAFINDSFGAFSNMNEIMGEAAANTIESAVYAKLVANGVLKDNKAVFHTDRANLGSGLLTSPNLSLAKAAMLKIVAGEIKVGAPAKFLIVPADLEDTGYKLVTSGVDVGTAGDANPHRSIQLIATPFLANQNDWYLTGSPNKTIVRCYLNGQRTPMLKVDESRGTEALGFSFRMIFDIGLGVRSPHYMYKSQNG